MKRELIVVCVAILALAVASSDSAMAQPQYYNSNDSSPGGANAYPFNVPAGKLVQLLYLPGDFSQPSPAPAGSITSVSFLVNQEHAIGPWTYSGFTIKLGQSSITSFTTQPYGGALTTVYSRSSVELTAAAGTWLTLTLDTPFAYNPAHSLIVEVSQCGAPGATSFSSCFTYVEGGYRRIFSGVNACPFDAYGMDSDVFHVGISLEEAETAVPAITGWGGVLLALLLGTFSVLHLGRRRPTARQTAS